MAAIFPHHYQEYSFIERGIHFHPFHSLSFSKGWQGISTSLACSAQQTSSAPSVTDLLAHIKVRKGLQTLQQPHVYLVALTTPKNNLPFNLCHLSAALSPSLSWWESRAAVIFTGSWTSQVSLLSHEVSMSSARRSFLLSPHTWSSSQAIKWTGSQSHRKNGISSSLPQCLYVKLLICFHRETAERINSSSLPLKALLTAELSSHYSAIHRALMQ